MPIDIPNLLLGLCLALAAEAADRRLNANTFGVARL